MKRTVATLYNPAYRKPLQKEVVLLTTDYGTFAITEELGVFRKSEEETEVTATVEGELFAYTEEPFYYTGANENDVRGLFED